MDFIWLPSNLHAPNAQGIASLFTANGLTAGVDNADPSDSPFDNRLDQWIPFDTTLKNIAIHTTAAPGVGKTENYRVHRGTGAALGALIQLAGAAVDVTAAPNVTLVAMDPTNDNSLLQTRLYSSAWVTASPNGAGAGYGAFQYSTPAQLDYQWYVCAAAHALTGATFGGSAAYASLVDTAIAVGATTQATKQFRVPAAGKLKFAYAVWRGWLNTSTVVAVIQKGTRGAATDTAISLSLPGHASSTSLLQSTGPDSTEVTVAAGDYVNWRIQRTVGAATSGRISLGVGYTAFTESPC